ncbi:MAG: site-2 protease family protein [Thermoguttaceae bacterium]
MSNHDPNDGRPDVPNRPLRIELIPAQPSQTTPDVARTEPPRRRRIRLPVLLFLATCLSTLFVGSIVGTRFGIELDILTGLKYALPVMTILICHEAGHFLQARRHGVRSSLPYFLPMPFTPLGTFGAVIAMDSHIRNRRALFDIGVSGPLAGLVPTVAFCVLGLHWSEYVVGRDTFGDPLLLKWLAHCVIGPQPPGEVIVLNPTLFAGWVGLLITAVNLMPIGQLDGGHVLYALLRTRAHLVARLLLLTAFVAVILSHYYPWALMLCLLMMMGPDHPPTADDHQRLGPGRTILGWLTLAFILIGFTPTPIMY